MNIHEHQAKELFKNYGIPTPNGVVIFNKSEIEEKVKKINNFPMVVKAQIHAGGRGKAGGIKLVENNSQLLKEVKIMFEKTLITHQTGPQGKKVKRVYIEEVSDIKKEFYLSCLIDRSSSKIAFISSASGGVDIESIAKKDASKIVTTKLISLTNISSQELKNIIKPFNLTDEPEKKAIKLVKSMTKFGMIHGMRKFL